MASPSTVAPRASGVGKRAKGFLFFAFAFAVMADPVSSVAYAIEAPLRALGGHLSLLLPAMGLVVGIIALVTLNYWQLVRAFPQGGGSPEAAGRAFGEQWSFLPIGALVVDFALTIAISIAAAGSAVIAYVPGLAPARIPIALGLVVFVAALTWFGHAGRMIFAVMTCLFIIAVVAVLAVGWVSPGVSEEPCKGDRKDGSCLHLRVIRAIIWVVRARSGASPEGERSDPRPSSGERCCRGCRGLVGSVSPSR